MGQEVGYKTSIAEAVHDTNQRQRATFARRVIEHFGDKASAATLTVWGLAFKGRTDDVRQSPAIDAIRLFLAEGMTIRAHDPEANANALAALGDQEAVKYFEDGYEAADGADALVVFTDWPQFRTPDFQDLKSRLARPVIFDGRNLSDPDHVSRLGFEYHSVGRPTLKPGR